MAKELLCFKCGKANSLGADGRVGRKDDCESCGTDLHSCKNCGHYDSKIYNECRETQADRVQEKERANFCDHFVARTNGANAGTAAQDLKSAAEALFRKK